MLHVIEQATVRRSPNGTKRTMWVCRCKCGRTCEVSSPDLRRHDGKAIRACAHCAGIIHGHTRTGWQSPTYKSWRSMLTRVKRDTGYKNVSICKRWLTFSNFLNDMGERPEGCTLDRYPSRFGPYSPDNCRWATPSQQMRNTAKNVLVRINGQNKILRDWLTIYGISSGAYYWRIKHGMSSVQALTTPLRTAA